MNRITLAIALMTLVTVIPLEAKADWQFAKWGMSLDELITASNGKMHEIADNPKNDSQNSQCLATGTVEILGYPFQVNGCFSNGKLGLISFDDISASGEEVSAIVADLQNKYGQPSGNSFEGIRTYDWIDQKDNNVIHLIDVFLDSDLIIHLTPYGGDSGL